MARPRRKRAFKGGKRKLPSRAQQGRLRTGGLYGRFKPTGTGPELKFFDTDVSTLTVATNGVLYQEMHVLTQGTGPSERVGRKVTARAIYIRGQIILSAIAGEAVSNRVRIILGVDTQTNGAPLQPSDLLVGPFIDGFRNLSNSARFRVLKELKYSLNPNARDEVTDQTIEKVWNFSMNHRCMMLLEFLGTTGTISETKTNSLFLLFFSNVNDPIVDVAYTTRLRYSDSWYVISQFRFNVEKEAQEKDYSYSSTFPPPFGRASIC